MCYCKIVYDLIDERKDIMIKRITAALAAFVICVTFMAGCGGKSGEKTSSGAASDTAATDAEDELAGPSIDEYVEPLPVKSLTIDGTEIDTDGLTMLTIDGIDISFDEFRFYYFYTLDSYKQNYGVTEDTLRENQVAYNQLLENVIMNIKQELVTDKLAADYNVVLDEEDQKVIENNKLDAQSKYDTEQAFQEDMQRAHLTEEIYEKLFVRAQTYNKVMNTLFYNDGIFATSHEDFLKLVQDPEEYAHEVHIMIPFYSQVDLDDSTAKEFDDMTLSQKIGAKNNAYDALDDEAKAAANEKAKAVAEEALKRAQDGEDFFKLVEEYGWDMFLDDPKKGYYMKRDNTGGYPKDLLDMAFSLQPGEVSSELVENSKYGYFIVKRLEPDMDYINENLDEMIASHDQPAIEAKFSEVMDNMEVTYCDQWSKLTIDSIT